MARVPFVTRESMTPEGQTVWDEIESSRGAWPAITLHCLTIPRRRVISPCWEDTPGMRLHCRQE